MYDIGLLRRINMNSRKFFYDFGKALYHVDSFYDEFAKQSNVSSSLLWVLYALNDGNSHTQIEISNDWELPKTTVNTVIKDIQKEGYVELVPIKGKRIPLFKLHRIAGTVLDRDKAKKTVMLLTTTGVVAVKIYGAFEAYDRQISVRGADGKKLSGAIVGPYAPH